VPQHSPSNTNSSSPADRRISKNAIEDRTHADRSIVAYVHLRDVVMRGADGAELRNRGNALAVSPIGGGWLDVEINALGRLTSASAFSGARPRTASAQPAPLTFVAARSAGKRAPGHPSAEPVPVRDESGCQLEEVADRRRRLVLGHPLP
jgi:hypothetical protein